MILLAPASTPHTLAEKLILNIAAPIRLITTFKDTAHRLELSKLCKPVSTYFSLYLTGTMQNDVI